MQGEGAGMIVPVSDNAGITERRQGEGTGMAEVWVAWHRRAKDGGPASGRRGGGTQGVGAGRVAVDNEEQVRQTKRRICAAVAVTCDPATRRPGAPRCGR